MPKPLTPRQLAICPQPRTRPARDFATQVLPEVEDWRRQRGR